MSVGSISSVGSSTAANEIYQAYYIQQQEVAAANREAAKNVNAYNPLAANSEVNRTRTNSLNANTSSNATTNANAANNTDRNQSAAANAPSQSNPNGSFNSNQISLLATQYDIGAQIAETQRSTPTATQ